MSIHLNSKVSRRNLLGGALGCSFVSALSSRAAGAKSETWAFLSDVHIHSDPGFVARNETNPADNLRRVVAEVLAEKEPLAGVVVNGDCAYNEGLRGDYDHFAKLIAPLVDAKIPIHLTMGNHDDREPFFAAFSRLRSQAPPIESKHVGLVESGVANFLFLDSLREVNETAGEFGEAQLSWLKRFLDANPGKPALLVGHHYPEAFREDVIPSDKPIPIAGLADGDRFLEILAGREHAKAYIYGHSHLWGVTSDAARFHHVNLPPTAHLFDVTRPNGWVRAKISATGMTVELRALDPSHREHGEKHTLKWR